jgi:hypothetical protein
MVPLLDGCHSRPDIYNHPGGLMAKHQRDRELEIPFNKAKVGVTIAGIGRFDQYLLLLRRSQLHLFNAYGLIVFS